jgi:hypothetical protein
MAHILDIGRGKILLNDYRSEPLPEITPAFHSQVINLMNFLKKDSL